MTDAPEPALVMTAAQRAAMVACGYIPFANIAVMVGWLIVCRTMHLAPAWQLLALAWLLLAPPIVVRLTLALRPLPAADVPLASAAFRIWWFTAQWQTIFNRLPWIEEMLRLIPGLYSTWLRLWGARVGRFVYWTPGLRILDRSLVDVGHRVVFGVGVKINPHVIGPGPDRRLILIVAPVRIGNDALVGGYSVLTSGSWIGPGEMSPARREFRPFTGWSGGRRVAAPEARGVSATAEGDDG